MLSCGLLYLLYSVLINKARPYSKKYICLVEVELHREIYHFTHERPMLMCIDYLKITMLYRLHIQGFLCFGLFYMENNQTIVAVRFTPFNHSFYDFLAPYLGSLQHVQLRLSARYLRASWHHKFYIMVPETGIEPVRGLPHGILSPRRLPVPPLRHKY